MNSLLTKCGLKGGAILVLEDFNINIIIVVMDSGKGGMLLKRGAAVHAKHKIPTSTLTQNHAILHNYIFKIIFFNSILIQYYYTGGKYC